MAMTSATEIQPRTTGFEELDFEPPCGRHSLIGNEWRPTCEHPATWFGIFSCCGHACLVCDRHKSPGPWDCLACNAQNAKVIHWGKL
jgi:hypothetical protein